MEKWEESEILKLYEQNGSVRQTAKIVRRRYDDVRKVIKDDARREVREFMESVRKPRGTLDVKIPQSLIDQYQKKRVVGVISDLHAPFTHPAYIDFLKDTFEKWGVTDIVMLGDLVDLHAISRHQTEPVAKGAVREYDMAIDIIKQYTDAFPKVKLCLGNHDLIPNRQVATLGMPDVFLKSFKDLWQLPDGWEIEQHFIIDNVLFHHGLGASGINGAVNKALNERMSVVQGHQHSSFQIDYRANQKDIIFGMSVGCGVDNKSYAFFYGAYASKKPILGTAIIKSSSEAYLVPMPEHYFRTLGR